MCPDNNVFNCFYHYNGPAAVLLMSVVVVIYLVVRISTSSRPHKDLPTATVENGNRTNPESTGYSVIAPSSVPAESSTEPMSSMAWITTSVIGIASPLWLGALVGLLLGLAGGAGLKIDGVMILALFLVPLWGTVIIASGEGCFAFVAAICYYVVAFVVAFVVGGIALVLSSPGGLY